MTKSLERGKLEAGLLCLSSPSILCRHLLPLVAVRGVPFAAVPDLSRTVASLLGIKRTMCIGVRVCVYLLKTSHVQYFKFRYHSIQPQEVNLSAGR